MRKVVMVAVVALLVLVAVGCQKDYDFDEDGKADLIFLDGENADWYRLNPSTGAPVPPTFLAAGHGPWAAGDYDGDHKWEPGAAAANNWWSLSGGDQVFNRPSNAGAPFQSFVDMVPEDYDGDGKTDPAYYRESDALWVIKGQADVNFGTTRSNPSNVNLADQDYPVPGDYDGDGKADLSTYNPRTTAWRIRSSKTGLESSATIGQPVAFPVPADYDGNGTVDRAVMQGGGVWVVEGQTMNFTFGPSSPIGGDATGVWWPTVADYDGDKKADPSYVEFAQTDHAPSYWHIRESKTGMSQTYVIPGSTLTGVHPRPAQSDFDLVLSTARIVYSGKCALFPAMC